MEENNSNKFKIDKKIDRKYLTKDSMSVMNDYFWIILIIGIWSGSLFFIAPTIPMIIIWILIIAFYIYIFKNKNWHIITSVTIYKYKDIFMEILFKSFKLDKDMFKGLNKLFRKNK